MEIKYITKKLQRYIDGRERGGMQPAGPVSMMVRENDLREAIHVLSKAEAEIEHLKNELAIANNIISKDTAALYGQ